MSMAAPMMVSGAAPSAPGAGGAGTAAVIPSQMMPMSFPANFDYSAYVNPGGGAAPRRSRRSRRSQRHRHHDDDHNHRRSTSQSSGSDDSDPESPYTLASSYDSDEYPRHNRHHRSSSGHNPLPRPPKDILSSTPFRPILTQLPSAQYNSWGLGGTSNPMPQPQPQPQPQSQSQPTTYSNIRPRRERRRFFNRQRDQYPVASLGVAANSMSQPFMPPGMGMPEPQFAPQQQQPPQHGGGMSSPAHIPPVIPSNSPMPMPNPEPAPPPPQGPVIPPGTNIPMPMPGQGHAGSTPFIGASLGTPRTPRSAPVPPPGQMMMVPSPASGHVPMPTPMTGGSGNMPMPMPSPGVGGAGGFVQTPVIPQRPGSILVNATMSMPSPSLGGGVLKFNGYGEYAGLLYHSPHSVVYEEDLYPTALHLFEARKFLDHRPDLADRIRQCGRVEEVTAISAELAEFTRRDWGNVALSTVSS